MARVGVIRSAGAQMIMVDTRGADHSPVIRFASVPVGRHFGAELEVTQGLSVGMLIVINPNADMMDGMQAKFAVPAPELTAPSLVAALPAIAQAP